MFVRRFGFWDIAVQIGTSLINAGGAIGSALISSKAAKDVAKIQAETQQATILAQERLAQLQLQALKGTEPLPNPNQTKTELTQVTYPQPQTASVIPSQIGGVPIIYLAIGGLLIYLLAKE